MASIGSGRSPERDNMETENKFDSHLLDVLLQNVNDGIFIADQNFNTIAYSETYRTYLGATREEMASKKITDFYHEGWLSSIPIAGIIREKKRSSRIITYYKTGMEILCTGVPVLKGNEIEYVILSFRDISMLKQVEEELRTSRDLLNKYQEQANFVLGQYASITGENLNGIIFRSQVMRQLLYQLKSIARYDSPVLITGQTGTGKSMLAELIHQWSGRASGGKCVKVNCANIPENLLESELFGYSQGAFTGASVKGKMGLVELADGGTLFLDEIGEMPLRMQAKLLNMIEDKQIKRVGDTEYRKVDVRIVSATNRDLEQAVREGSFRRDLYYRLNTLAFELPPLANRREDIIPLINYFLEKYCRQHNLICKLSLEAYRRMLQHSWPGNVRELAHTVERIVLLGEESALRGLSVNPGMEAGAPEEAGGLQREQMGDLNTFMTGIEREYLSRALNRSKTVRSCAQTLGIDVSTLVRKMKRYGLSKLDGRNEH